MIPGDVPRWGMGIISGRNIYTTRLLIEAVWRKALTGEMPSAPSVIHKPRPPSSGLGGVGPPDDQPPTTVYIYSGGDIYIYM